MATAACRIEDLDIARVFFLPVQNVEGLLDEFFLAQVLVVRFCWWRLLTWIKKNLVWPSDKVSAVFLEVGLPSVHLVPEATKGIIGKELYYVPRREELVADSQLAAVPRRRRFLAHRPAFLWRVEVLIHPANGFILGPELSHIGVVEQR